MVTILKKNIKITSIYIIPYIIWGRQFYLNINFAMDRHSSESELNSKAELGVNIFEGTDFSITIVIDAHGNKNEEPIKIKPERLYIVMY